MFSPFKGWEKLLDMEGANSMTYAKSFCLNHKWPNWNPVNDVIMSNQGEGELQKVAVFSVTTDEYIIYFPDNSNAIIDLPLLFKKAQKVFAQWYNPKSGDYTEKSQITILEKKIEVSPPGNWSDSILILSIK